jgi:trk system potassium uptake protein TrkH
MRARTQGWQGLRAEAIGVDLSGALNLVGALAKYLSLAFVFPAALALGYSEPVWPFAVAGLVVAVGGLGLERVTQGRERIGVREGFLVVALTWLVAAFAVSLPYVLASDPQLGSPLDAYFEAMSGMTTTGATVLTDIDALPRSILMWRQLSQWLGGMGIIVLALAVLPRLRIGGRQLLESELPGPDVERLTASIRQTARRLWALYVALTAAEALALAIVGWSGLDDRMGLFEAVAHAFTTLPTGGFSTEARSIEAFTAVTQWVIVVFMVVAGANFALTYRALRRRLNPARDEELRLYLLLLLLASAVIAAKLLTRDVFAGEDAIRHAVFQAVSMMTTTGYASADFAVWPIFADMILVGLMFVGGSAGSTAGSIKVVRFLVLGRFLRRELDQAVHREAVVTIRLNREVLDERVVRDVAAFVLLYITVFALGTLGLVIAEAVGTARPDLTWPEAISATATTLGNVGPGLGFLGPMGSFDPFTGAAKAIMIVLMWMGRLELLPVVVLLTRSYWRA